MSATSPTVQVIPLFPVSLLVTSANRREEIEMCDKAELTFADVTYVYIDSSVLRSLEWKAREYDMLKARERAGSLTDVDHAGWQAHVRHGRIVDAIKLYRTLTGIVSLKECKDAVCDWRDANGYRPAYLR
ncbi:hypothetical protein [Stenotrophomonas phage StenR_269]|nr:hypothetical protein [Stenotrophomonas phage StenR_269]